MDLLTGEPGGGGGLGGGHVPGTGTLHLVSDKNISFKSLTICFQFLKNFVFVCIVIVLAFAKFIQQKCQKRFCPNVPSTTQAPTASA